MQPTKTLSARLHLPERNFFMKKAVGIIAEYNPFHNGHAYQIEQSKKMTNADFAVILMSGDFVQRGAPAIFSKHERTKMALLGGADIVLELPGSYATGSAEFFAKGGVGIFHALNCVDFLSFGSESGNLDACISLAQILKEEPADYQQNLKKNLKQGLSFPSARKDALETYCQKQDLTLNEDFLEQPNNILGIEYCKALLSFHSSIEPVTLKRKGSSYHSTDLSTLYPSASAIRRALKKGTPKEKNDIPVDMVSSFSAAQPSLVWEHMQMLLSKDTIIEENDFSLLLKYQLLQHNPETLCQYADLSPDLSRRIYKQLNHFQSFSQFVSRLKTKELTYTRISRGLLHALLGITPVMQGLMPSYVRLLGFRRESSEFLRIMQKNSQIPLITKGADYGKVLNSHAASAFEKDLFLSDLYESVKCAKKQTAFVNDLQKPPVIL